jgi:hypothetical protein
MTRLWRFLIWTAAVALASAGWLLVKEFGR